MNKLQRFNSLVPPFSQRLCRRCRPRHMSASCLSPGSSPDWRPLQVEKEELVLSHTLPVGQTFRWVETGNGTFTGKLDARAHTDGGALDLAK